MYRSKSFVVVKAVSISSCRYVQGGKVNCLSNTPNSLSYLLRQRVGNVRINNNMSPRRWAIATFSTTPSFHGTDGQKRGGEGKVEEEYDEQRHEEYEREAQEREVKVRYFKKVFSSLLFMGTLFAVMFSRRRKQSILDENLSPCTFLLKDDNFQGTYNLFCRYGRTVLPVEIVSNGTIKAIHSFKVRSDDVFVASFPKTGTTWVQEIAYRIKTQNYNESSDILENRFPFLEYPYPGVATIEKQQSPRFIKTHLTYDLLPKDVEKAKIIYVTRNPKDTVVSYYHFVRMLTFSSYKGTFEEFLQKFKKSELPYTPFFSHVDGYLAHSNDPNVLVVTYEALTKNPASIIRKIGMFLEKPLSEEEIQVLVKGTSFEEMKKNPGVNYEHWDELGLRNKGESPFMRKGTVGDWRHYFTSGLNEEFDIWEKENNSTGYKFEYEV